MSGRVALRIIIHGRVQGVGYRAFVEREARKAELEGWVRNRRDGSVEALLAGPSRSVEAVLDACRRGPFAARVDDVEQREATAGEIALMDKDEKFSVLMTR